MLRTGALPSPAYSQAATWPKLTSSRLHSPSGYWSCCRTLNFLHFYLVQCNGITYRYVVSTGKRGFATLEPAPIGLLNDGFAVTPRRVLEVQPIPYQEPDNLEDTARHRVNQRESVWSEIVPERV